MFGSTLMLTFSLFWHGCDGYVHLPTRSVDGTWTEHAFKWPLQESAVEALVTPETIASADLYFAPRMFRTKHRREADVLPCRWLYADLDPVNPEALTPRPTVAWRTSTGRYQCAWKLTEVLSNERHRELNKSLTQAIGADPSGWDPTQVLRVPGSLNHKRDVPERVELLWNDGPVHTVSAFSRFQEARIQQPTRSLTELLSQYKLPPKTSRLLQYPKPEQGQRSETLYRLGAELVEAEVPLEGALELLRASKWNKYQGRDDELERLRDGLDKAYAAHLPKPVADQRIFTPMSFDQLMAGEDTGTHWLVEDLWTLQGHGIVAGEPKTFKSTIALDLCVSVASGKPLWGQFAVPRPGPVLIIQNENALWIQRERLHKIVASKGLLGKATIQGKRLEGRWGKLLPLSSIDCAGFSFDVEEHKDAIWEIVREQKPALVVFDPLYQMSNADVNSAKDLSGILRWLMLLRSELKTGVMLIHHFNKNGLATRGGQRLLGSTTLHGWTESALYTSGLETIDGAARITIEREFRAAGAMDKLVLSITDTDEYRVEVSEASEMDRATVKATVDKAGGKMTVAQIQKATGLSRPKVMAAVDDEFEVVAEGKTKAVRRKAVQS